MKYSILKDGTKVSLLGLGGMRLPLNDEGKIDKVAARAMVEQALAGGINYFDTAYGYHHGESETFFGEVLSAYPRERFYLADKIPMWVCEKPEDVQEVFEEQLQKCKTNYFDFYLVHSLTKDIYQKALDFKAIDYLQKEKEAGRIKRLGFSFHDEFELFEKIITAHEWDFCQIQFNYMDENYQAGVKGLKFAAKNGLDLVIMEPLKGGKLANLPEDMQAKLDEQGARPAVDWAFSYLAAYPEIKLILSGMSTAEQMKENLALFSRIEGLTEDEKQTLNEAKKIFAARQRNLCTNCKYCMPCPQGVDIPNNFITWNDYALYGRYKETVVPYFSEDWDSARADKCVACGRCETLCPQHLKIIEDLKAMNEEFTELKRLAKEDGTIED